MSIASPCINICRMNGDTGLCEGCYRNIDEIARWSGLCDADKLRVLAAIESRRAVVGNAATPAAGRA
ncbi:MAG TPA: DUF1289 domain-containing protein [Rhodocyclaceae bacterium]|jgi:uncharacterized protein|nr:DUF1289 domain-containing protein [Rhodocyclaceae bacterium]